MSLAIPTSKLQHHQFRDYLFLIFGYLIVEGIFSWLFVQNSGIVQFYLKMLSILTYAFLLWHFKELNRTEKILIGLFTMLVIKLVFESLWKYDTFFKQFTVFTVIYPVVFVLFIKYQLSSVRIDSLEFVAKFYLILYLVFMLFFGRAFSFGLEAIEMDDYGPFSGDTRIIHARSVYMLIIPMLWFLNCFLETKKVRYLLPFLLCMASLIVHQHRSVWSCVLLALLFYAFLLLRSNAEGRNNLVSFIGIGFFGALLLWFIMAQVNPGLGNYLSERFNEIFDPTTEGSTGNFRVEQMYIYGDYIMEKPFLGWSFEGFSLPNPLVDWWDENTGHHFHEGFIEILFYHGVFGLLLKYGFLFYLLIKAFTVRPSSALLVLLPFCISGLIFSLNYVLPLVFWGHTGMCLFYLNENERSHDLHHHTST